MSALPALGLDLGGTKIEARLLDAAGQDCWRERVATPQGDYAGTLKAIAALVEQARTQPAAQAAGGLHIGIGTPGTVTGAGLMKNCNSTWLNGRPLPADLRALLGQPVAVANDANCLALSEATDGAGAGAGVVFAVILGTGVGGGVVVDGRVLGGPHGLAGEWGHNPLPWADAAADPAWACYCGKSGCIETLLSGPGLAHEHQAVNGGPSTTAAAIAAAAVAGDAAAAATLERHAQRLARALAAVVHLLDPDCIVLGGGLSQLPGLAARLTALLPPWLFGQAAGEPLRSRIMLAQHGDASGVRGAAWLGRAAG
jgi:fructokinase